MNFDHGFPRSPFQQLLAWRLPNTREFGGAKWPDCKRHNGDHDDDEDKDDKHGDRLRPTAAHAPVYRPSTRYWPHAWKRREALAPMVSSERGC